jgi:transcription antitermination factor NusG
MSTSWNALYTRPRHERQVFEELTGRGVEAFLPTYKVRRRWSDRYKIVEEPLFKSYLFVRCQTDGYYETLRPYGAVSFVRFDAKPAEIPEAEVEAIRRLVESELPYNPYPYLRIGRKVRVKTGPLEGCEGILTRKKGLARLVLSIDMLQQSVIAEVDADCVEPL